jgi:hypothetical protein
MCDTLCVACSTVLAKSDRHHASTDLGCWSDTPADAVLQFDVKHAYGINLAKACTSSIQPTQAEPPCTLLHHLW